MERESVVYDVVAVCGGPSGLTATTIRLAQMTRDNGQGYPIDIIGKDSEIGAHILFGAVIEPRALDAFVSDWRGKNAPLDTLTSDDRFVYLTKRRFYRLPTPSRMVNEGSYIAGPGTLCRWLVGWAKTLPRAWEFLRARRLHRLFDT